MKTAYSIESFTNFGKKDGLKILDVESLFEDKNGRLWVGGNGGLYRKYNKNEFFNITKGNINGC